VAAQGIAGRDRAQPGRQSATSVRYIPPGLIVAVLLVLIVSQLCFAFLPYRRRAYVPVLLMTALGFALGQAWDFLGLPSLRLGQANLLPALVFALMLQPLARFVPRPSREPREPRPSNSNPRI
jgi:hypothetical protein